MTASAGAWYRVGKVDVVSGSKAITGIGSGWQNDVVAIAVGDFFTLDSKTWYEVTAVISDTRITLDRNYEGATASAQNYAIVRNTSGTILTRIAGQVSVQFNQKQLFLDELRTWLNSNSASETLTDSHGITQSLKTPSQMVRDHDNRLAELDSIQPFPWAMRKVEFEANRKQNNEMFAASGFVHFGTHIDSTINPSAGEGLWTWLDRANTLSMGVASTDRGDVGSSKAKFSKVNMAGVEFDIEKVSHPNYVMVSLPPAESGKRTYNSVSGISVDHATAGIAFASETATNKVVTNRVDMWGLECFLREITSTDSFVYDKGLIQSQATHINNVATVTDTARPLSYFAWYDNQEAIPGKGVNWETASESQRIRIAGDPRNNIFFDDLTGKFYQWCLRGRSFAGAGNGDWEYISPAGLPITYPSSTLSFVEGQDGRAQSRVKPQGNLDSPRGGSSLGPYMEDSSNFSDYMNPTAPAGINTPHRSLGLWSFRGNDYVASQNECYFLVCGAVNRLNQGAYHPSFNASGANLVKHQIDYDTNIDSYNVNGWQGSSSRKPRSTPDCFLTELGGYCATSRGKIGTTSGRPDGRFFDAIYASGPGGICQDVRYSAWGLKLEDFTAVDLKVKSGRYRGREKVKACVLITESVDYDRHNSSKILRFPSTVRDKIGNGRITCIYIDGQKFPVQNSQEGSLSLSTLETFNLSVSPSWEQFTVSSGWYFYKLKAGGIPIIFEYETSASLADHYTHTDVVGDPSDILLCHDLKDGWIGGWVPVIPDGVGSLFPLGRKYAGSGTDILRVYTTNIGASWVSGEILLSDPVKNETQFSNMPTGQITIYQYPTKAAMTKASLNTEVYGGEKGLGGAYTTSYYSAELVSSLLGKILTRGTGGGRPFTKTLTLKTHSVGGSTMLDAGTWFGAPTHEAITIAAPDNDSIGLKALNYSVKVDGQGFINYAYTELKHDGTDWGDDGKINIVHNQATRLDDNGNAVVYGTAQVVDPLGWIKNDK